MLSRRSTLSHSLRKRTLNHPPFSSSSSTPDELLQKHLYLAKFKQGIVACEASSADGRDFGLGGSSSIMSAIVDSVDHPNPSAAADNALIKSEAVDERDVPGRVGRFRVFKAATSSSNYAFFLQLLVFLL